MLQRGAPSSLDGSSHSQQSQHLHTPRKLSAASTPQSPELSPQGSWSPRTPRERTRPHEIAASPTSTLSDSTARSTKPIPSPLQQASLTFPALDGRGSSTPIGPASPRSPQCVPSPYHEGPRSPREKLDALLAEEDRPSPAHHTSGPSSAHSTPGIAHRGAIQPAGAPRSAYAPLRNASAPLLSSAAVSPPSSPSPGTMAPPSRPSRPEARTTAPRNHSIDSQVSSLSSNASQPQRPVQGHQHKSSQDVVSANPPDLAGLIGTAGSPEAALLAMWREKQSASNHNAQLWRLVEKQRAMIIGLNKDLERALKDKDRYRKKLKDYVNQVPPVPGAPKRSDTIDSVVERGETPSPAPSERQDESAPLQPPSRSGEHKTSPLAQGTTATQIYPEAQLAQSPPNSAGGRSASNPSSAVQSDTGHSAQPLRVVHTGLGLDSLPHPSTSIVEADERPSAADVARKQSVASTQSSGSSLQAPALSITQPTPVLGPGEGFASPTKPSHPLRKAPPAPLNLSKPNKPSAHLHQAAPAEHSDDDDDYDDTLEVDEIPIVERGRRKTREEDDRVREAMAVKDEEARSNSKKKKSESKSKSKPPAEQPAENDQNKTSAGSLSPRMFSPQMSGLPISPRHPPAHSLNALLSPTNSDSSMMANRSVSSVTTPLMSPGLPTSPRPGDRPLGSPLPRNPRQGLASPPMSPRSGPPNGIQPRPPRQPIPLPPNTPLSFTTPQVAREPPTQTRQQAFSDMLRPPGAQPSPDSESSLHFSGDGPSSEHVYRGLVSEQYPGLLLPPNALPSIDVKVFSSRLRPSRLSYMAPKTQEEDPIFTLAIYARSDGKQLWRLEKPIMALPALDSQVRSLCEFTGKLPDRALFSGHAPAKMDARRAALNSYFDIMLETPMSEKAALVVCEFFSTDVIGARNEDVLAPVPVAAQHSQGIKTRQQKEGYLTKRGKNFGGWKARYFILDGPEFRYYEQPGGAHLGTIKLHNAQIGKQSQQQVNQSPQRRDDSEDNQYRHAFLILEPKRKDSSSLVRHVLCAESDEERDAWVDALLQHVDWQEEPSPTDSQPSSSGNVPTLKSQRPDPPRRKESSPETERLQKLQAIGYEETVAAEAPIRGPNLREAHSGSPKIGSFATENGHYPSISGPTNGAPIQNAEFWGNKSLTAPTSIKDKKRSIFGFRGRPSSDFAPGQPGSQQSQHQQPDRSGQPSRNIFGIPLQEAVEFSQPTGVNVQLPAVVYRCIEYLKGKKAYQEEGIFRLSGSNIVIKGLRDRFNNEGDVKLLSGDYYDVHAVASLLKLYLRELPASILTRELHIDFLKVLDMDEREKKIQTFNVLVHRLPRVNFELLQAVASFLILIVDNAGMNKMTVRNVGIVFAPTLNIPAPLISMFLTDFPEIFGMPVDETSSPIHEIHVTTPPLGDEAIRSPRHQMFSDLPTPAYNQTSFQHMDRPQAFPMGSSNTPQLRAPPQPQQHGYDTGFIPLRPSYDAPNYGQQFQQAQGFGSLNNLQPESERDAKQKRRESGMLLMNMGMQSAPRKGSIARMREDTPTDGRMVQEETAFD